MFYSVLYILLGVDTKMLTLFFAALVCVIKASHEI